MVYAITLEFEAAGAWETVRLWDNADSPDEHHEHAHTRIDGKQVPAILDFGSVNDAMSAAIDKAKTEAAEMVRQWQRS